MEHQQEPRTKRNWIKLLGFVIGIILGIVFFAITILLGIEHFDHILALLILALVVSFAFAYVGVRLFFKWVNIRTSKIPLIISLTFPLFVVLVWIFVLTPKVNLEKETQKIIPEGENLKYLDLATGSRIGYFNVKPDSLSHFPPLIYLHGGPGGGISLKDIKLAHYLAKKGLNVYLYDQAGVGYSEQISEKDYTVNRMVEDLEEIRKEIQADSIMLLGQSWGSVLATKYYAAFPERVKKLVLTSPGAYVDENLYPLEAEVTVAKSPFGEISSIPIIMSIILASIDNDKILESYISQSELDILMEDAFQVENYDKTLAKKSNCANINIDEIENDSLRLGSFNGMANFRINYDLKKSVNKIDARNELNEIKIPTLIVIGSCDYISPEIVKDYNSRIAHSTLEIIPNGLHTLWSTDNKIIEIGDLISNFIKSK